MSSMSKVSRIIHRNNIGLVRLVSTQSYIPGRKGYAPGFEAPEGTRDQPKPFIKRRDIGHSLVSHLEGSDPKTSNATQSPKKLYRQQLTNNRHKYAHELLEKQGQKQIAVQEKLALTEKKSQEAKQSLEQEKTQQKQHEKEVVEMLNLEENVEKANESRNEIRVKNRLNLEKQQRDERRKQLLKLYSATRDFVTLDNLDSKVDTAMNPEGRSFHESLNELLHNTNTIQSEIEKRKLALKEVMGL